MLRGPLWFISRFLDPMMACPARFVVPTFAPEATAEKGERPGPSGAPPPFGRGAEHGEIGERIEEDMRKYACVFERFEKC